MVKTRCWTLYFRKDSWHIQVNRWWCPGGGGGGIQIFRTSSSYLKFWAARRVTWTKFHTANPQLLVATIQNLVPVATWCLGFVQPWWRVFMIQFTRLDGIAFHCQATRNILYLLWCGFKPLFWKWELAILHNYVLLWNETMHKWGWHNVWKELLKASVEVMALSLHMWEVPGSNLRPGISYPDWEFLWVSSVHLV